MGGRAAAGHAWVGTGTTLALVVAAACGALVATAGPAAAHDDLVSVTPGDGSTVTSAPAEVVLEFSDVVQPMGTGVVVRGADGRDVSDGTTRVDGTTVTQALAPLSADGTYYVSYRVVSADGHPVSGTTTFVAEGVGPDMTPAASPATGVRSAGDGPSTLLWVLVGGVALALVVGGVLGARRRVRS